MIVAEKPQQQAQQKPTRSFGDRIMLILNQQRRTKAWLAEEIGISKQNMNYLLKHSVKAKHLHKIAEKLNISPAWLQDGIGPINVNSPANCHIRPIPILAIEEIKYLDYHINQKSSRRPHLMGEPTLPKDCFAILLDNNSMEPHFKKGSSLIFDSKKTPISGDYVVISLVDKEDVLFRQMHIDGNDTYFRAIDSMYRNIQNEPHAIHGVLMEARAHYGR